MKAGDSMVKKLIAEFLGTAFLLAIVVGSGIMAQNLTVENIALVALVNAIATGVGLIALILMFGNLSGAHFNPVLILSEAGKKSTVRLVFPYIVAQIVCALAEL